ncbi:hypothetical protein LTR78_006234 [Recurvomyces mirabilis]|uniref:FAD-binding PCMH-type domain-containing protein n=1 Tax=Recurvomyces mirabilis TaxID=574656 RepID=A0AAE1C0H6_9PEZI|nr:hypothetical protein LTR78_006234 [Recurvomyces mirabilis]KAK5152075.1 hypothetical protein LTS14_008850 [Recurvomyces mirabilis]
MPNTDCVEVQKIVPGRFYPKDSDGYKTSVDNYWSKPASEQRPACIVRPLNAEEVAIIVRVLNARYEERSHADRNVPFFAVRSGGHSPEAGFANIEGGVLLDLSLLNDVAVSQDNKVTSIGVGARWGEVSTKLDSMGLAIVGGRNSDVGVGGLVLGGGISFFSPRFGMVCDNIDSYDIVLANGTIAHATAFEHSDLWRALKGGSGNFGIVTSIVARTFVAGDVWAGYGYWPHWQAQKILKAFVDFNQPANFDEYAAGPIVAFVYIPSIGLRLIASSLVYTRPEPWPRVFNDFNRLWRYWSTAKVRPLTDATDELHRASPRGARQFQVTTTVVNDLDTLTTFHEIFVEMSKVLKNIPRSSFTFTIQPLSAAVTHKGSPNVLGLEERLRDQPLIIILLVWVSTRPEDDEITQRVARDIIGQGEVYAKRHNTADPYRYLNYAASGQEPFFGDGYENLAFMRDVSRIYDPQAFFQRAKRGGFKLGIDDGFATQSSMERL